MRMPCRRTRRYRVAREIPSSARRGHGFPAMPHEGVEQGVALRTAAARTHWPVSGLRHAALPEGRRVAGGAAAQRAGVAQHAATGGHCPASDSRAGIPGLPRRVRCVRRSARFPRRGCAGSAPAGRCVRVAAAVRSGRRRGGSRDPRGSRRPPPAPPGRGGWRRSPGYPQPAGAQPPARTSPSASTRSRRVCRPSGMSPISSRNRVPPSACCSRPRIPFAAAPVKAPPT